MPAVVVKDLKFSWRGGSNLLDIPRFDLDTGDRVFLHGPSGSGKSTLLNLLTGMLLPQQGSIHISGTDIASLSGARRDQYRADKIGFIFQTLNLLPYLSLTDNVAMACRFSETKEAYAVSQHGSVDKAAAYFLERLGLAEPLQRNAKVTELSVGQQQRVAVARALIGSPSLIIADEPTSALDKQAREQFVEILNELVSDLNTTLIMVSHDEALASSFKRSVPLTQLNEVTRLESKVGQSYVG